MDVESTSSSGWKNWNECTVCGQHFYGKVQLAMGWECWKTYVRLDAQHARYRAMNTLGDALRADGQVELALSAFKATLPILEHMGPGWFSGTLIVKENIATCLHQMGRDEEALSMEREVYQLNLRLRGPTNEHTLVTVCNVASSLLNLGRYEEAARMTRSHVGPAQKKLGADTTSCFGLNNI